MVNAFQVSGGYRKRNQTFYVYRDTDTLAYERMTDGGELVFGWMFRPVLGRRSVSPGLRQLLAVISLPRIDCDHQQISMPNDVCRMDLTPTVLSPPADHRLLKKEDMAGLRRQYRLPERPIHPSGESGLFQ
jgi:hypothetical protein